jgi:hypothetical protein
MSATNTVAISPYLLGKLAAPTTPNTWYQTALSTSYLQSKVGGLVSMAITGETGDVLIVNSHEAGASLAPELIVTYQ